MSNHRAVARRVALLATALAALGAAACVPASEPAEPAAATAAADLLILGGTIVTMDTDDNVVADGGLAVRDGEIVAIGSREAIAADWTATETITAGEHDIVMPGLINGHGHAPMVLLRGIADDLALMDWLENYIFPAEASTVNAEFVRVGTRLAAMEMIRSGTTTFVDGYYFEDDIAEIVDQTGLRAVLGETIIDFPVPDAAAPAESLAYSRAFIERWLDHPRITATVFPHSPYTVAPEVLREAAELAREYGVPVLTHLAETEDEVRQVEERYGRTPTEHLDELGVLGPDFLGAHGIWLTDEDIARLARHDAGLVHNPESNMKLASGIMRLDDLRAAGIAVGLGTDGAASNNDLDMFGALLTGPLQQKNFQRDPRAAPAAVLFAMATREGARALNMDDSIGALAAGLQADIVIVDGDAPNLVPRYDDVSHLVYAARGDNVRATVVAGRVLYLDGDFRTLDPAATLAAARTQANRIRDALGLR